MSPPWGDGSLFANSVLTVTLQNVMVVGAETCPYMSTQDWFCFCLGLPT